MTDPCVDVVGLSPNAHIVIVFVIKQFYDVSRSQSSFLVSSLVFWPSLLCFVSSFISILFTIIYFFSKVVSCAFGSLIQISVLIFCCLRKYIYMAFSPTSFIRSEVWHKGGTKNQYLAGAKFNFSNEITLYILLAELFLSRTNVEIGE